MILWVDWTMLVMPLLHRKTAGGCGRGAGLQCLRWFLTRGHLQLTTLRAQIELLPEMGLHLHFAGLRAASALEASYRKERWERISSKVQICKMPLLAPHLLMFFWPRLVTWESTESMWETAMQGHEKLEGSIKATKVTAHHNSCHHKCSFASSKVL